MQIKDVIKGIRTSSGLALVIALSSGMLSTPNRAYGNTRASCMEFVDPGATYPRIPSVSGPDVTGEAGVMLYIGRERALVELDGCLYELDRPLNVDVVGFDTVSVLVTLLDSGPHNRVFVSESGAWIETIEAPTFSYVLTSDHELGLEVAGPTQMLPTAPVVIAKPSKPK